MYESEIVMPSGIPIEYGLSYSMPEKYITTSSAVLWRVRKAGKYFIIKTPGNNSSQSLALLQREYELSLGKSHPNIVNIYDVSVKDDIKYIVMEYIEGDSLSGIIKRNGPMGAEKAKRYIIDDAAAAINGGYLLQPYVVKEIIDAAIYREAHSGLRKFIGIFTALYWTTLIWGGTYLIISIYISLNLSLLILS